MEYSFKNFKVCHLTKFKIIRKLIIPDSPSINSAFVTPLKFISKTAEYINYWNNIVFFSQTFPDSQLISKWYVILKQELDLKHETWLAFMLFIII